MSDPLAEPRQQNGSYEDRERKHWRAFWDELPGWVRTTFVSIATAGTVWGGNAALNGGHKEGDSDKRLTILETKFDAMRDDQKEMKQDLKELLRRRDRDYAGRGPK